MKEGLEFPCHPICSGTAGGPVLISSADICFYLCDPETGMVIEKGHPLEGQSVAGKILVFPGGKGSSVVQADGLYQLSMQGNAPKALVIQHPETVLVTSAIIMDIPLVDRVETTFYQVIKNGDQVFLDAQQGRLIISRD